MADQIKSERKVLYTNYPQEISPLNKMFHVKHFYEPFKQASLLTEKNTETIHNIYTDLFVTLLYFLKEKGISYSSGF